MSIDAHTDKSYTTRGVDPVWTKPHYSSQVFRGYIAYAKSIIGQERIDSILKEYGLTEAYFEDTHKWLSVDFSYDFCSRLSHEMNDRNFAYNTGKFVVKQKVLSLHLTLLIRAFGSPYIAYRSITKIFKRFNRVVAIKSANARFSSIDLVSYVKRHQADIEFLIPNTRATLEYGITLFGIPPSNVEVEISEQDEETHQVIYHVKWSQWSYLKNKFLWACKAFAVATPLIILCMSFSMEVSKIQLLVSALLSYALITWIIFSAFKERRKIISEMEMDLNKLEKNYLELQSAKESIDRRLSESTLIRNVMQRVYQADNSKDILKATIKELVYKLGFDHVAYYEFLPKDKKHVLRNWGRKGVIDVMWPRVLTNLNYKDVSSSTHHVSPERFKYWFNGVCFSKNTLCVPMSTSSTYFGAIFVCAYETWTEDIKQEYINILSNIGGQLSLSLNIHIQKERESELRKTFQKYVPFKVLENSMGTQFQSDTSSFHEISVLFTDIRNFTHMMSRTEHTKMTSALNAFYKNMSRIVDDNGGVIDKYLGDGVLAHFNTFQKDKFHAENAVKASRTMLDEIVDMNEFIKKRIGEKKSDINLSIGVGVNTGKALVGNMGSEKRMEFTAIGEAVNLASRLEKITKRFGENLALVSHRTFELLTPSLQSDLIDLGKVPVAGLDLPVQVHCAASEATRWKEDVLVNKNAGMDKKTSGTLKDKNTKVA